MENIGEQSMDASEFITSRDTKLFLGNGGSGELRKCFKKKTPVVVKRIKEKCEEKTEREAKICKRVEGSSKIVKFLGIVKWLNFMALVMEWLPRGNLLDLLKAKDKALPWGVRLKILCDIADALIHLHTKCGNREFIHGDVKSENVLITEDFSAKLSDFGATNTKKLSASECDSLKVKKTSQCTTFYSPPEFLKDPEQPRTVQMDVYSFGCIVYETITRTSVFSDAERPPNIIELHIMRGGKPNDKRIGSIRKKSTPDEHDIIDELEKIQKKCLYDRPSIVEVRKELEHICDVYGQKAIKKETQKLMKKYPITCKELDEKNVARLCDFTQSLREVPDIAISIEVNPSFVPCKEENKRGVSEAPMLAQGRPTKETTDIDASNVVDLSSVQTSPTMPFYDITECRTGNCFVDFCNAYFIFLVGFTFCFFLTSFITLFI